jgi:hypothetical protein
MSMSRLIYWPLILLGILASFHLLLTGSPVPLFRMERLHSPKDVASIEADAIVTTDGTRVALPNAALIRERPILAKDILERGIEVFPNGEIIGLFRIDHWYGNDPVRFHLARVNLASLTAHLENDPRMLNARRKIDPGKLSLLSESPEKIKEMLSERSKAASLSSSKGSPEAAAAQTPETGEGR